MASSCRIGTVLLAISVAACQPGATRSAAPVRAAAGSPGTGAAHRDPDRATRRIGRASRRVPGLGWLRGVIELVRSRLERFHDVRLVASPPALPALQVRSDGMIGLAHHLLVNVRGRWWLAPEPLVDGRGRGILRVLDASPLGSGAVLLAVAESYDGGSELGGAETWLYVFCDTGDGLTECARKQIGLFRWALAADERHLYPRGAYDLRARPHIEAELEASVTRDGLLQLSVVYSMLPADRSEWEPEESCLADDVGAEEDADEACNPVSVVERLIDDAGTWRLEAGHLVPAPS
jgi:hypothetical protein